MSNLTYYCTCCNAASGHSRRDIEDIGFNLRKPFWDMLFDGVSDYVQNIQKKNVSQELNTVMDLSAEGFFCYLSRDDIRALFPGKPVNTEHYEGTMVVTYKWFKEKSRKAWARLREATPHLPDFPEDEFPGHDEVMYRGSFILDYHNVWGVFVPKEIHLIGDAKDTLNRASSRMRRCACGRVLSRFTGTSKEIIIAMQGSSRAGKTTGMIAIEYLLNQLVISAGSPIYIESSLEGLDPEEKALLWVSAQHHRYKNGRKVVKTEKATVTEDLIYSFRLHVNGNVYVLTMVDMAGEIFDEEATLSDEWKTGYRNVYSICDAVWTFIPYQTLTNMELDWPFLLRHRRYYESKGEKAEETYRNELETWKKVVTNDRGSYPSYQEYLAEVRPESKSHALLNKYACVHEARLLEELGETNEVLRNASPELFRTRLEAITKVWSAENRPPHAVILTKSDSIGSLFLDADDQRKLSDWYIYKKGPSDTVLNYWTHPSFALGGADHVLVKTDRGQVAVDEAVMNRICRNVRKFFMRQNPHSLQNFAVLNEEQTCAFALSAYGGRPVKDDAEPQAPKPYHALLPLLWTLAAANVLPVSYVQTDIRARTPEEVKKHGNGWVVTEHRVSGKAKDDATIQENLYCVGNTYHYHESKSID